MKKELFTRQVWLLLLLLLGIPIGARADREVLQQQFGKQTITVAADEVITFYDWKGTESISMSQDNNSQSLTVFTPAEPGQSIQITFESCDVKNDGSSYPGKVYVYNGNPDADDSFTWATSTSGVTASSTMPSGDVLAEMDGSYADVTYTSTSSDGVLSVGMLWRWAKACSGWKATVKAVSLENMTVTGAGSNYDGVVAQPQGKTDLTFANAYVTAAGILNPDHVTGIWFTMTQNDGAVDPLALKLYKGTTLVNTTVAADGDGYKMTLDEPAVDGTLTLTIKGDYLGTADVGAKVQVDITKIATTTLPDGVTPFTAGTSVAVENPALVFMSATPQTISVGETPMTFYDEGGANGNYVNDQNDRIITFVPKNEGKVVQIDFSQFNIYYSSWSTPAQFKVYSGTSASGTLLWEPTAQADYTAGPGKSLRGIPGDGGAITIVFNAKTTSTKDGWTATVSEYQPVQMVATSIEATQTKTTDACIGGMNEALLTFNIQTEGSLDALVLNVVKVNLKDTYSRIDRLNLYALGETDAEPTGEPVGSVQVTENTVDLPLASILTLREGNNYFRLTADISADATPETTIDAAITGIVVAGGDVVNATAGDPDGERTLKDMILMSATGNTFTVQDGRSVAFYDEGGADGGIVSKTNGRTTFLSGMEGKKVMVDFTTNAIWHGSLYNQELRIYNGQEVNAANLIKTLQQGETGIVRSTAEDGSLTVVLYSDASNAVAADGWEATVSLFEPVAMDFDNITTTAASTETVCGGDENQDMLAINVKAVNTEPAMQVTKMAFSAGENFALATHAALFFGSTKVGETDITAAAFEITLNEAQTLVEGDNLFTLKYTISDEAMNDQKVSAQLVSVTALVNNAEKTETIAEPVAVERTVKNIVLNHLDQGTVTKTVNGSIAFETKPKNEYSTTYETGTDNRINIFVPKHEGMVCQIDFESFKIYYYSYNVSSSAKFKIYNGQGTSGEVLWEPSTQADYTTGPGRIIRSTAADGALTVVFNPNSSYSTNDGWKSTVSEYLSKDMEVTAVEVTQSSTADASIGVSDQELLTVNVKTEGNLTPLAMSSMKVNLKGTEANISKVSVWQDDTKLGEADAAAEVEVTFDEAVSLVEGDNLFVVKVDVKSDATENETIDAKVVSITAGSVVVTTDGDPDGARTLKNQILMTAGNHGTINLGLGNVTMLYDDGGPEGDGADGVEATVTFAPTGEATSIKLTDKGITFAYTAYLYIYEGSEVNDDHLLKTLNGSSAKFDPIIVDGPVTIKYVGAGSYTKPNFAMQAEGYMKTDVAIIGITTEDISVNEVLKGQTDTKMLKIMVEAKGELTPAEVTAFDITGVDGEAVEAYHIYQTGTATTFSPVDAFNGSYSITETGTYYFWLTYDVKANAEVGQTATATLNSITVNNETITVTELATASFTVASGKSGDYIVGQGGDYATIQGAIDDIGVLGMDGPVTLKIKAGEYNEKVRIPNIKGLGATNTLTIESESGQRDVKIYHNNYTTAGYSEDQHKKDYGVVTLYEANYVTLKNLEIYTTDKAYKAIVMVKDESRHVTIDNCYLHAPICTASSGEDVCLVGHTIIDEENRNNDYLTVKNCLLEGGKMGVSMGGTSYVALPKEVGGIIENNTFKNNGQKALYVMDELGVKIRNNTVIIEADAETKNSCGWLHMQLRDEYSEATEITGNIFNIAAKTYCTAMYLQQMEGTEAVPVLIANNVINMASLNASYAAFEFKGDNFGPAKMKYVNVANNTIRMTGSIGGAAFWVYRSFGDDYGMGINVVNNIIQNETNGYAVNLHDDANLGKINFANNVMYTAGETFYRASSDTEGDFDAFVTATGATGCVNKLVTFQSDDYLMPATTLDGDLLTAQPLSYVTTDIEGYARPTENISIGAYEYSNETETATMAEGYPIVKTSADETATVAVKSDAAATVYALILPSTAEAPTAVTLKASENTTLLQAETEAIVSFDGLTNGTEYKAYFLLVSQKGGVESEVYATDAFIVTKTPTDPVLTAFIGDNMERQAIINKGETAEVSLFLVEGTAPYTFTVTDETGEELHWEAFAELPDQTEGFTYEASPEKNTKLTFTVVDGLEKTASVSLYIYVIDGKQTATFDDILIESDGHISVSNEEDDNRGYFVSGSYKFNFGCMSDYDTWWWYGYANSTSTSYDDLDDQWNNIVGGGYEGSAGYGVAYPGSWYGPAYIEVLHSAEGDVIPGFYITNTAYAYTSMSQGDGFAKKFGQGDWFKVTATGYDSTGEETGTVDFYLADFRSDDVAEHYIVNDWRYFDLSTLGVVKKVSFEMSSTDNGSYGMNTPCYFAFDNFGAMPAASVPTGIHGIAADQNVEGRYSIDGKTLTRGSSQKGVQLVRMKDGTVRKVLR